MKLVVNALSIGSMSGGHVVYGFLRPLAAEMIPEHQIEVIHYERDLPPTDLLDAGVTTVSVSEKQRSWVRRGCWEFLKLPSILKRRGADVVLNVSGSLLPRCPVPQVVLCQNPWCYRPIVHKNTGERIKAMLQRWRYAKAFRNADLMIYISNHLRDLYRQDNIGAKEARSEIAYVGLNQETFAAAERFRDLPRDPFSILSVSAMASWKGAHTLVEAVALLRGRGVPARLRLAGPWPQPDYEARVRQLIGQHDLEDHVQILGRVSDEELHRQYATNMVYALPSQCESFGIPAAEAMAFGTPVVSTTCCAISEICAPAGKFGPADDPMATATLLGEILTNKDAWGIVSQAARVRAGALSWTKCCRPFLKIEEIVDRNR